MHFKSHFVAVSLGVAAAVSHAMPLVVSFVPDEGNSGLKAQGPKDQTGHYEFAFQDGDKKAPPAQPGGYGLAHWANPTGDKGPDFPLPPVVLPKPGQNLEPEQAFNPPGHPSTGHPVHPNHPGQGHGPNFAAPSQVPEPGSLALLMLSLTGLLGLRLGRRSR